MKSIKLFSLTLLSAALTANLTACGGGGGGSSKDPEASLRILHASKDAPAIDVLINDTVVATDLSFQEGTAYLSINPGSASVKLREHGSETILANTTATFDEDGSYSVIAHNYAANLSLKLIDDSTARDNDSTDMRLVNALLTRDVDREQEAIDVFNVTDTDNVTSADAAATALAYGADLLLSNVSNSALLTVTEDEHRDTNDPLAEILYSSGSISLSGDTTAVVVNADEGASLTTVLLWTSSGVTEVMDNIAAYRLLNLIDDQNINVYANGTLIAANVSYEDEIYYRLVEPGTVNIAVSPSSGDINDAIADYSTTLTLARGDYYTLIAAGDELNEGQMITLNNRNARGQENKAMVRYVNASYSTTVNPADVYLYTHTGSRPTTPTGADVAVGTVSGFVTLPLTNFSLEFCTPDTTTVQATPFNNESLFSEAVYSGIVYGNASGVYVGQLNEGLPRRNNAGK